jgi:hypothetical protein
MNFIGGNEDTQHCIFKANYWQENLRYQNLNWQMPTYLFSGVICTKWLWFLEMAGKVWKWTLGRYILHIDNSASNVEICFTCLQNPLVIPAKHSYNPRQPPIKIPQKKSRLARNISHVTNTLEDSPVVR